MMPPVQGQQPQYPPPQGAIAWESFRNYGLPGNSPATAPIIDIGRLAANDFQLKLAEIALTQMAWAVNWLTKNGAIFNQIVLPPNEAAMKYRAMQGGGNAGQ